MVEERYFDDDDGEGGWKAKTGGVEGERTVAAHAVVERSRRNAQKKKKKKKTNRTSREEKEATEEELYMYICMYI